MGQLDSDGAIFLSAGVPDPTASHFLGPADSTAISAAVSALLYVTLGRRVVVWGGQPGITPMIWAFAETMGLEYGAWIKLYQSRAFEDEFPEETKHFNNVVFTDNLNGDVAASLRLMRRRMLLETRYSAAVFIGGMGGIMDEYAILKESAPDVKIIPIISTGGAARRLGEELGIEGALETDLDYIELFYNHLGVNPNERRYANLKDQPTDVELRVSVPRKGSSPPR